MIFSASQCTPISNYRDLPSRKNFKTNNRLYKLNMNEDDIFKIIMTLNINKVHGHDDIPITALKIFDSVLTKPLSTIFKTIDHGVFPDTWQMSHIISFHQKTTITLLIITTQFLFCLFVEKYLKEPFLIKFLNSFQ